MPTLPELFESLATARSHGTAIIRREDDGELHLVWANDSAAHTLKIREGALRPVTDPIYYATWQRMVTRVLGNGVPMNGELGHAQLTVFRIDDRHVATETHPRDSRFEALFSQHIDGVFFMVLDEPIDWKNASEPERQRLLEYAFEHLRYRAVNDVMCTHLGQPREHILGSPPSSRWQDRASWCAYMRPLYDNGHIQHTVRAPQPDGKYLEVEGAYVCTYDEHGRITGHFGTQRDVTDKRRNQVRLELAIQGADLGVWEYDPVLRRIEYDPLWLKRLGYDLDAVPWRDTSWWRTVIHPLDFGEFVAAFRAHLEGRADAFRIEHRIRTANSDWRWMLTSGRVTQRDHEGQPARLVGITIDVTERKQLQDRLAVSERMASVGTLAAGIGHEINNPLTYIVLNLELLERELDTMAPRVEKMRSMIAQARYGSERVRSVVRDLQSLTRAPEQQNARIEPVAVIERCLAIADHQIRHRAQVLREFGPIPAVRGNEGRMVQLFLNLLVNAAQAIPEGHAEAHRIRVSTSTAPDGRAVIIVSDTGVGIPADVASRIFDPFFTTKQVGEGTGLGLAISRSIVSAMGGEIEVDSAPGVGTTFKVVLPPAGQLAVATVDGSGAPAEQPHRLRVLVVDDEPQVGNLLVRILDQHDVIAETSARAALERLRAGEEFDRILCDLMMPDVTGMDFYEALEPALQQRVIFLTGGAFTDRARAFLGRVKNRRLDKPFDMAQLLSVLDEDMR